LELLEASRPLAELLGQLPTAGQSTSAVLERLSVPGVKEVVYLSPKLKSREELDAMIEATVMPDASSTQRGAQCPRLGQYALRRRLARTGDVYPMMAGKAIHGGLSSYYVGVSPEECIAEVQRVWGLDPDFRLPAAHRWAHLHSGHLEVVMKNYFPWAARHDTFKPIALKLEDMDLSTVLGAIWRVTDEGLVVLGESKVCMEFVINGETFIYSGIPDLPVEMGGAYYVFDHKSTSSYLSEWYFEQFDLSMQLRCYCGMVENLTHLPISGALINGIYVGEKASDSKSKAARFMRYGPIMFSPGHLVEAFLNQYYWRKTLDHHEKQGYYPQHSSKLCGSCDFKPLCDASPSIRESIIQREYTSTTKHFLNI
jgi:hypothetical protein